MRRRTIRTITVVETREPFGRCACGAEILYYSDYGVKCSNCGKLYGLWSKRRDDKAGPALDVQNSKPSNPSS